MTKCRKCGETYGWNRSAICRIDDKVHEWFTLGNSVTTADPDTSLPNDEYLAAKQERANENEQVIEGEDCPICSNPLYVSYESDNPYCKNYHTRQQQLEQIILDLRRERPRIIAEFVERVFRHELYPDFPAEVIRTVAEEMAKENL